MLWRNKVFSILEYREDTEDYIIKNTIACSSQVEADIIANTYGENAMAIDTTLYAASINDTYKDKKFFNRNGEEIIKQLTEEEKLRELETKIAELEVLNKSLSNSLAALLGEEETVNEENITD